MSGDAELLGCCVQFAFNTLSRVSPVSHGVCNVVCASSHACTCCSANSAHGLVTSGILQRLSLGKADGGCARQAMLHDRKSQMTGKLRLGIRAPHVRLAWKPHGPD